MSTRNKRCLAIKLLVGVTFGSVSSRVCIRGLSGEWIWLPSIEGCSWPPSTVWLRRAAAFSFSAYEVCRYKDCVSSEWNLKMAWEWCISRTTSLSCLQNNELRTLFRDKCSEVHTDVSVVLPQTVGLSCRIELYMSKIVGVVHIMHLCYSMVYPKRPQEAAICWKIRHLWISQNIITAVFLIVKCLDCSGFINE